MSLKTNVSTPRKQHGKFKVTINHGGKIATGLD